MKFEELENVWALQQPANTSPVELETLQRSLATRLGHHRRVLIASAAGTVVGLILMQVLFFANFSSLRAEDQWIFLARLLLHQGVNLTLLAGLIRLIVRRRRLARGRADSIRAVASLSVISVEEEMADYRALTWIVPVLTALALFSAYLGTPVSQAGGAPFALRAGLVFALIVPASLVLRRHYRRNLEPEHARLKHTLEQLDKTEEEGAA